MDNEDVVPTELLPYLTTLLRQRPLVRNEWDTEDFYQELSHKYLVKASRGLIKKIGKSHKMALLKTMALQMCADKFRYITRRVRDARRNRTLFDTLRLRAVKQDSKPFIERFQRLKAFLKPVYQEVLELRLEGLSWDEVAEKMQPRRTANSWYRGFQRDVKDFVIKELGND
jgi:DNA-directed RNA polymerase specialized sigma24 family protein